MKRLFLIAILVGLCSACSTLNDDEQQTEAQKREDQKKQELIIGKWVRLMPGNYHGYYIYRFRPDGKAFQGRCYDDPNVLIDNNPEYYPLRYAIFDGWLCLCDHMDHTHPLQPDEICPEFGFPISPCPRFTVDDTFLILSGPLTYTRVSKWSDVGLPDDLLPM